MIVLRRLMEQTLIVVIECVADWIFTRKGDDK